MITEYLGTAVMGYVLGSLPTGLILGYLWLRRDVRELGSGTTGTTNVLRTAGYKAAVLVLVIDVSKGLAPVLIGRLVFDDNAIAAVGGGSAVVGHVWPLFAGFRGGRGVATAFGALSGLMPLFALALIAFSALLLGATRIVSVMSIVSAAVAAVTIGSLAIVGEVAASFAYYTIVAVAVIVYMHIPNIRRLLSGTEPRLVWGAGRSSDG